MIKLEFHYHVAYMHKDGFGCIGLNICKRISVKNIKTVTNWIEQNCNLENVGLINWKFLNFKIRLDK